MAPFAIQFRCLAQPKTGDALMKTIFAAMGFLVLSMSGPGWAEQSDWSQQGDYYPPNTTTVQRATPQELHQFQGGDYYAPGKTTVLHPTPQELNQFREGDYYAPTVH
jgi:hypothetical protein